MARPKANGGSGDAAPPKERKQRAQGDPVLKAMKKVTDILLELDASGRREVLAFAQRRCSAYDAPPAPTSQAAQEPVGEQHYGSQP